MKEKKTSAQDRHKCPKLESFLKDLLFKLENIPIYSSVFTKRILLHIALFIYYT